MELKDIRTEIDKIDTELASLLAQRLALSREVASSKRESGKAVRDTQREEQILRRVCELAGEENAPYVKEIYTEIMRQSRALQENILSK